MANKSIKSLVLELITILFLQFFLNFHHFVEVCLKSFIELLAMGHTLLVKRLLLLFRKTFPDIS